MHANMTAVKVESKAITPDNKNIFTLTNNSQISVRKMGITYFLILRKIYMIFKTI